MPQLLGCFLGPPERVLAMRESPAGTEREGGREERGAASRRHWRDLTQQRGVWCLPRKNYIWGLRQSIITVLSREMWALIGNGKVWILVIPTAGGEQLQWLQKSARREDL